MTRTDTCRPTSSPITVRESCCDFSEPMNNGTQVPAPNLNATTLNTCDAVLSSMNMFHSTCTVDSPIVVEVQRSSPRKEYYPIAVPTSFDATDSILQDTQVATTSPFFQRRGRFLIWPASFGPEHNATFASRS
jgi:hypothetical protein